MISSIVSAAGNVMLCKNAIIRMKGKTIAKLAYTDTLFRFRMDKHKKILQKAYKIGRERI
jgi:hypothetical protein